MVETAAGITSTLLGEKIEGPFSFSLCCYFILHVVTVSKDMDTEVRKVPLGVCASIAPFNFPALVSLVLLLNSRIDSPPSLRMIPLWTIPMAAVTGNTLILKPSERDPGAAMMIAELCQRAGPLYWSLRRVKHSNSDLGLPSGVLNIVHGGVPTVNAICDHPAIKAISFVGGDRAGKHIYERSLFSYQVSIYLSHRGR